MTKTSVSYDKNIEFNSINFRAMNTRVLHKLRLKKEILIVNKVVIYWD